jgi:hypothetical protein
MTGGHMILEASYGRWPIEDRGAGANLETRIGVDQRLNNLGVDFPPCADHRQYRRGAQEHRKVFLRVRRLPLQGHVLADCHGGPQRHDWQVSGKGGRGLQLQADARAGAGVRQTGTLFEISINETRMTPVFLGAIRDGKLFLDKPDQFKAHLANFPSEKRVEVTVEKVTHPRSGQQNRYYFGVVVKLIMRFTEYRRPTTRNSRMDPVITTAITKAGASAIESAKKESAGFLRRYSGKRAKGLQVSSRFRAVRPKRDATSNKQPAAMSNWLALPLTS